MLLCRLRVECALIILEVKVNTCAGRVRHTDLILILRFNCLFFNFNLDVLRTEWSFDPPDTAHVRTWALLGAAGSLCSECFVFIC